MTTIPATVQERIPLPPAGRDAAASAGITGADLLGILKQRILQIILLWFLFGCMAIGLFFLAYFKFPEYSAEALIECISDSPKAAMDLRDERLEQDSYERFIRSQAMLVKSSTILGKALKDPIVRSTQWFQSLDQDDRLLELEDELHSSALRDTNFVKVSIATRSIEDPHRIVNTVVDLYLSETKENASQQYRQELDTYKRELANVRSQINQKKVEIQEYIHTLPPGEVRAGAQGAVQGIIAQQLVKDQETVALLQLQEAELDGLSRIYNDPYGQAITQDDRLMVEQDPRVAGLESQVTALDQELVVRLNRLGPNHRETKEMLLRLEQAAKQLEITRADRLREVLDSKKEQIETARDNSQHALVLARECLQESQAQQADLDRKLAGHQMLLEEMDLLVQIQNRIDEYIREIERIVTERSAVRVQRRGHATMPLERSFPSLLLLPAAVIMALAMSVGVSVGLELIDTSVKTTQDLVRHVSIPVLGSIPDIDDEEVEIDRIETAVVDAPQSMVTEAFRTIRSNLQFSAPADQMRSLLITSPKPEDGKTTIAMNLASSLVVGGKRVLLVDANLRRPALRTFFPSIQDRGLANILVGDAKLADCVHSTDLKNLDVVGSGPAPPNPAELLGSALFSAFLAEVTRLYDHVILDSPPVLLASDATVLATLVDGTILVCRAKYNTRGVVQRANSLLQRAGAHVFGSVLNAAQVRRGGYFREQLRTFYEYQGTEDEPARTAPPALGRDSVDPEPSGRDADDHDTTESSAQ